MMTVGNDGVAVQSFGGATLATMAGMANTLEELAERGDTLQDLADEAEREFSLGRTAYEAFCGTLGFRSIEGGPFNQFDELNSDTQTAWINAAKAAVGV